MHIHTHSLKPSYCILIEMGYVKMLKFNQLQLKIHFYNRFSTQRKPERQQNATESCMKVQYEQLNVFLWDWFKHACANSR